MDDDPPAASQTPQNPDTLLFRLPDLGEGLTDAELQTWLVTVGDQVTLNQTIAEVETAKAVVALPSPSAGTVLELLAEPGETIPVGAPLIRLSAEPVAESAPKSLSANPGAQTDSHPVLVGYGPEADSGSRRAHRTQKALAPDTDLPTGDTPGTVSASTRRPAVPAARKLAEELGLELSDIHGTGPGGAVTIDDVRKTGTVSAREERTPIRGIRKRTAEAMIASARDIPQASASITVDCSAAMDLLAHLRASEGFAGLSVTPLVLVAKSVLVALTEFPALNAYWDAANQQIITKRYVNLGIAVATERGLLVPTVKEAQDLSLRALCQEIGRMIELARTGQGTPADLSGGTITLSNVGVFGVETGTPLVNPGESAILCVGAINKRPWVIDDEIRIAWVTTLTLGFDHRLIDGELAARFLTTVANLLAEPFTLLSQL